MLNVRLSTDNSVAHLEGQLTFSDHQVFRIAASKLMEQQSRRVVIDLEKLDYIDSIGLGMLLMARDEAQKSACVLVLKRPSSQVRRMFDISKFDTLFHVEM